MPVRLQARSKFGAVPTTIDGIRFASKREALRYSELRLLEKAGEIRRLKLQPRYGLCALVLDNATPRDINSGTIANRRYPVATYVADFEYEQWGGVTWVLVIEDAKGTKTSTYILKKKLFEAQYGFQIHEV